MKTDKLYHALAMLILTLPFATLILFINVVQGENISYLYAVFLPLAIGIIREASTVYNLVKYELNKDYKLNKIIDSINDMIVNIITVFAIIYIMHKIQCFILIS